MADESKKGRSLAQQSWIWMIVAVVATIGLMVWLGIQSEQHRAQVALMEEEQAAAEAEELEDENDYEAVALSEVAADPAAFEGRDVRVANVVVGADLGQGSFWAHVADASPFLVVYSAQVEDPPAVTPDGAFDIHGRVRPIEPQDADEWIGTGRMHPDAREQLDFATHYLSARRVRAAEPEAGVEAEVVPDEPQDAEG